MNNEQNEITLGQLFRVIKKSFKRAIIYILVSLLVASALLFTLRAVTSSDVYTATVSFKTAGENNLTVMNQNKSQIVKKVMGADTKADAITENLTITAVVPEKLNTEEAYIPTSFEISVKSLSNVKLSSKDYKAIVDEIAAEYLNLFSASELPTLSAGYKVPEETQSPEYFLIASEILDNANLMRNTLSSYLSSAKSVAEYRAANGLTGQDVLNNLDVVIGNLKNLQLNIVINENEKTAGNLINIVKLQLKEATTKQTELTTRLEAATTVLNGLKPPTIIIGGGNSTDIVDSDYYNAFQSAKKTVDDLSSELADISLKVSTLTTYSELLEDPAHTGSGNNNGVQDSLVTLNTALATALESYRTVANEYNSNQYLTSEAKIVNPAKSNTDSIISNSMLIIVLVAVAIIAYIVAFSKTYSIMKKSGGFANANDNECDKT